MFAPNHKLRRAVTALAIGNIGKRREAVTGGHGNDCQGTGGCCNANHKPRSHDTSRIAWAKLMARVGEEFPRACPTCGGDIQLREDGRQEPAHFEPEVRKRAKAGMALPAYSQPLTGVGREASKPRERPTGTRSAHPPEAHESLISRKTGAEVPLTGLSFGELDVSRKDSRRGDVEREPVILWA